MEVRETRRRAAHHQSQEVPRSETTLASPANEKSRKKPTGQQSAKKKLFGDHPFRDHPIFWAIVAIACLIACLEVGGNILYHHSIYTSYQPAKCLIQDKQVAVGYSGYGYNRSSTYYEPAFTYQVTTVDGESPNVYPEYAGPGYGSAHNQMYSSDDAQTVLDQYQIGQTYTCWYSLFGMQSKAVLVLQNYPWWELLLTSLGTWPLGFLLACAIEGLLYLRYRNWRLRKKGVAAIGMVRKRRIAFETQTNPIKKISVPYNRSQVKQGTEMVTVYYDPRYPRSNYSIETLPKGNTLTVGFMTLFLVILTLLSMLALWNG